MRIAFKTRWARALEQRVRRRALRWRAFRRRHALSLLQDRHSSRELGGVLLFAVIRNEAMRLPHFLDYYRARGVQHFFIVDNESDDESLKLLEASDISVWSARGSYRESRFGVDWINWLLGRYGSGHWCLTVDADELFVSHSSDPEMLPELCECLERAGRAALGGIMLDLYPEGPLDAAQYVPGDDPLRVLTGFDAGPFRAKRQHGLENLWVQGGLRERVFFPDAPNQSPTLNKLPLVKWRKGYVYVNSTHSIRPTKLNMLYDGPSGATPSCALLHTKFLPGSGHRAAIEATRGEHFHNPKMFDAYYRRIQDAPTLWFEETIRYRDANQLADLGLLASISGARQKDYAE